MAIIKASDIKDLDKALDESLTSGNLTIETAAGNKFVAFPLKLFEGVQLNGTSGVSMSVRGNVPLEMLDIDASKLEERVLASGVTLDSNNTSMQFVRDSFLSNGATVSGRTKTSADYLIEIPQIPKEDPNNIRIDIVKKRLTNSESMQLQSVYSESTKENPMRFVDYPSTEFPELSPEEKACMETMFSKMRELVMKHDIKIVFSKDVKDGE
ncbi:hypothetical protein [Ewingella americana]|uniref:Uncharacterized protein n=1 Tax=Ewingella americana TaxID=41202 RepID=A0A502GFM0_9GAMM|nr:hypothetical protein [Ewingella americana]TPG60090.1 hypothetical protein EAH77_16105 [Ewingella americana]